METEADRVARFRIEFGGAVAAVLQEFDAGQRGAEADMEGTPMAGLAQGRAEALDGVAKAANGRHAG